MRSEHQARAAGPPPPHPPAFPCASTMPSVRDKREDPRLPPATSLPSSWEMHVEADNCTARNQVVVPNPSEHKSQRRFVLLGVS